MLSFVCRLSRQRLDIIEEILSPVIVLLVSSFPGNLFKYEALWVDKRYVAPLISLQCVLHEVCVSTVAGRHKHDSLFDFLRT